MARASVAMGSALFVNRATNNETEKKITTVNDARTLPKSPDVPRAIVDTTIDKKLRIIEGIKAPHHIALLDSAISIRYEPAYLFW